VIGTLLRSEDARTEVIGSGLDGSHFYYRPYRLVFEEVVERYYGDEPIDPLTVAESIGPRAAELWRISEREAVDRLTALAAPDPTDTVSVVEHGRIIKRHCDYRELMSVASDALSRASEQQQDPEDIAGRMGTAATRIITGSMPHNELLTYGELGRRWTRLKSEELAARAAGSELGAKFTIKAIDDFVKGLRPTELWMLGGDPGVGKSAIAWACARNFAYRQMRKPPERRIATLVFSLEMGEELSSTRFAQIESSADGEMLRSGSFTQIGLRQIAEKWAANRELPLIVNHSGSLRESQLKALCVEGIRKHNVGLVIVDHFRFITTDQRFENKNDADEQVVSFLKGTLAKDLNLAVICLAHTTKSDNRRPTMNDLRGSKMISAFADLVSFPYWPWQHASKADRERGLMAIEEHEMIWEKVRQGAPGIGELWIDMATMTIR
jgi:replicative DNA helicase